ncbi:hypothetical protein J8847_11835 [Massilia sp. AB1]|nr:hypothetical protein [Massilia sp. AB1]MBQ5963725.1 hypothetical protein [Massilia sp. ZL223]
MTKKILIAALLACAFAPALAAGMGEAELDQAANAERGERAERVERRIVTRLDGMEDLHVLDTMPMLHGAILPLHGGRVVKNAPYSALAVSERVQQLADGNQIVRKNSTMNYRDSAGRTRTEVRDDNGEVRVVTIHDPVEGVRYILRPKNKTATKVGAPGDIARAAAEQARAAAAQARASGEHARIAGERARERIEQLRKEGKLPEGGRFIVKEVERDGEHKDVRIRIAQPGLEAARATREMSVQLGPIIAGAIGDARWSAKAASRDLGTRDFSGVKAQGQQRSYEIPAGEIGNRNPITVSSETWTSPDLQMLVYHKRSDPRSGEMVYRLEELKREEPAASLFAVPADYTVTEAARPKRTAVKKGE